MFINDLIEEYDVLVDNEPTEAEFSNYALGTLLKGEKRQRQKALSPEDRTWRTERNLQLCSKPVTQQEGTGRKNDTNSANGRTRPLWGAPPVLPTEGTVVKNYAFDLRPDCSYWLPTRGFNSLYCNTVKGTVYIYSSRMLAPYLTIEFERNKDPGNLEQARNQIASAAAVALYNRFNLKDNRLKVKGEERTEEHMAELRHYGMVVGGKDFEFWEAKPKEPSIPPSVKGGAKSSTRGNAKSKAQVEPARPSWNGCEMVKLAWGELDTAEHVTQESATLSTAVARAGLDHPPVAFHAGMLRSRTRITT